MLLDLTRLVAPPTVRSPGVTFIHFAKITCALQIICSQAKNNEGRIHHVGRVQALGQLHQGLCDLDGFAKCGAKFAKLANDAWQFSRRIRDAIFEKGAVVPYMSLINDNAALGGCDWVCLVIVHHSGPSALHNQFTAWNVSGSSQVYEPTTG